VKRAQQKQFIVRSHLLPEPLEGRLLFHAALADGFHPAGTLVPWLSPPITAAASPPVVSPPPVSPPPPSSGDVGTVSALTLINADADTDLGVFTSGAVLDRTAGSFSVRADVSGTVGSVQFLLDGVAIHTESSLPFSIAGDISGDYAPWLVAAGNHTLAVVPYSGAGASGIAGTAMTVSFAVTAPAVPPSVPPPTSSFTQINWTARKDSPIARAESLTAKYNDRLYVFGGFSGALGPVADSHYYDPATNNWTPIAPLPQPITHAGVAQDAENVYFVGAYVGTGKGYNQVFGSDKVWKYNFASNTYTEITRLPRPLAGGGSAIVNGKLHYFGGYNVNRTDTDVHLVLDLNNPSGGWQNAAPMLLSRNHQGAVVLNGKIYSVAGQTGTDEGLVTRTNVEMYDPATNQWTSVAPIPKAVSHIASATFVMDGRIIVMGGESAHNVSVRECWAYNPATNQWVQLSSLPANRFSGVANTIGGKIIFTTGGSMTTTWIGTPA